MSKNEILAECTAFQGGSKWMVENENRTKLKQTQIEKRGTSDTDYTKIAPQIALETRQFIESYVSKNTTKNYTRHLNAFLRYCAEKGQLIKSTAEIERSHVDSYKKELLGKESSPSTVSTKLAPILAFTRFALESEWVTKDVSAAIKLPRVQKHKGKTEALSDLELQRIINGLRKQYRASECSHISSLERYRALIKYTVFTTLCSVGMRASELVNLKVRDLDLKGQYPRLHISLKGGERHSPLIGDSLSCLLSQYIQFREALDTNDPLFVLRPHLKRPLTRDYLARMVTGIAREFKIEKEITPHSLRATVASHLHAKGVPIGEIQDLLGHRSILTTMMYVRKTDEEKQSAGRKIDVLNLEGGK